MAIGGKERNRRQRKEKWGEETERETERVEES